MARLMAEVGRPVNQTAIWKIENGTPRRTISLDEALALAQVFGLTLNELTQPPDEDFRAIRRLLTDLSEWNREEVNHREDMIELLARARTVLGAVDVGTLFDDSAAKATYEERASQMRELNHQLDLVKDALSIRLDLIESQGDADFVTLLPILPPVGPERPE